MSLKCADNIQNFDLKCNPKMGVHIIHMKRNPKLTIHIAISSSKPESRTYVGWHFSYSGRHSV